MFEIGNSMTQCKGVGDDHSPGPLQPPVYFTEEVFSEFSVGSIIGFPELLSVNNLCNQLFVYNARLKVLPLNAIIYRAVSLQLDPNYYYNITSSDRLYLILSSFNSNEDYLFDDPFTLKYLITVAEMTHSVPHITAQKIFDLSPNFQGVPDAQGAYSSLQRWNGFIIDVTKTELNSTNCIIDAGLSLPNLQSSDIYYLVDHNKLGQYIPHFHTNIFYNLADQKYYMNANYLNFVPNGYYDSDSEVVGITHKYYHIVDGVVVEILTIQVDPNGPTGN